ITTRAGVQIQGLEINHLPRVEARLRKVGLTAKQTGHDNIRNIFGHPFSGLMPHELIDTRLLCREVDAIYLDSREYSDLPCRLNICFNGSEDHPVHLWTQDLSFLASRNADGEAGFQVLIAGTQGQEPRRAWHLPVFVYPDQVVAFTQSILDLFRLKGSREKRSRSRLRFLVETIGVDGVLEWLKVSLPFQLEPANSEPVPTAATEELVGWLRQSDPGLWTMGLSVPLGRLSWRQLEGLAILSRKWGDGHLRTTHEQGIAVINIPTAFKSAAATDAAALGLSVHADEYDRNTMACTGRQFCDMAVTETKGHMLQLIDKLRKRALKLHGIRIHMSGCPCSCAQHFTADIGLKGVRVRRFLGTREGFDVFLGGGISGQVNLGLPYRLGVDVDQLPNLVEEITNEYYLRHKPGQTFSSFWRDRIQAEEAKRVGDTDYMPPTWVCDGCSHHHQGEDPPVYCPGCAGLRRLFARIEVTADSGKDAGGRQTMSSLQAAHHEQTNGFMMAAMLSDIPADAGLTVSLDGQHYALFRHDGGVRCIDGVCPHDRALLGDGGFCNGLVVCPGHNEAFDVCTGCDNQHPGERVRTYETRVENGRVLIRLRNQTPATQKVIRTGQRFSGTATTPGAKISTAPPGPPPAATAELTVVQIIDETPDVKTFQLDNSAERIPFDVPGKFARVCASIDGVDIWRSFTLSSSPVQPKLLELTIKRNPHGQMTNFLFDSVRIGQKLKIKGADGAYFFDPEIHPEPLVLVSAGIGITPMLAITRFIKQTGIRRQVLFLHGARTPVDIIRHDECLKLSKTDSWFHYSVWLTQPPSGWTGFTGRLGPVQVLSQVADPIGSRYFLCGPDRFMDDVRTALIEAGAASEKIHTERFHVYSAATIVAV
ncbi:MAG: Rieske 2Fe-2S domain-containing protein, partial [Planctomycetaceae bacterium]|nr:Rieske 2Fe-2S domain-containing protein [Planctomycetaceae bacterium]